MKVRGVNALSTLTEREVDRGGDHVQCRLRHLRHPAGHECLGLCLRHCRKQKPHSVQLGIENTITHTVYTQKACTFSKALQAVKTYRSAPANSDVFRMMLHWLDLTLLPRRPSNISGLSHSHPGRFVQLLLAGSRRRKLAPGSCPSLSRAQACCGWSRPDRNPHRKHGSGASSPPPRTLAYSHGIPSQQNNPFSYTLVRNINAAGTTSTSSVRFSLHTRSGHLFNLL